MMFILKKKYYSHVVSCVRLGVVVMGQYQFFSQ